MTQPTPEDRAATELVKAILQAADNDIYWAAERGTPFDWDALALAAIAAATPAIEAAAYQRGLGDGIERAGEVADNIESPFDHHSDTQTDHGFCTASEMIATAIRNLKGD